MREHNLLALSRVYNNISFKSLGEVLEMTPIKAEKMAARMIVEVTLKPIFEVPSFIHPNTSSCIAVAI